MPGEPPDAQLVRDFHEHQNRFYAGGEQGPVAALLTDDVTWHVPGQGRTTNEVHGREDVLRHFARRRRLSDATLRIALHGVLTDGERVVILASGQCRRGDERLQWRTVSIFRVAEGRIAVCRVVPHDHALYERIWSPRGS